MKVYSEPCDLTLQEKQAWPLEVKVLQTQQRIQEWYEHWQSYERTGCVFCMFGAHLDHRNMKGGINRFQLLKQTHPKLWNYCMDKLDLRMVMDFLKLPIE